MYHTWMLTTNYFPSNSSMCVQSTFGLIHCWRNVFFSGGAYKTRKSRNFHLSVKNEFICVVSFWFAIVVVAAAVGVDTKVLDWMSWHQINKMLKVSNIHWYKRDWDIKTTLIVEQMNFPLISSLECWLERSLSKQAEFDYNQTLRKQLRYICYTMCIVYESIEEQFFNNVPEFVWFNRTITIMTGI